MIGKSLSFSVPDVITYKIKTVLFNLYFAGKVKSVTPLVNLGMLEEHLTSRNATDC